MEDILDETAAILWLRFLKSEIPDSQLSLNQLLMLTAEISSSILFYWHNEKQLEGNGSVTQIILHNWRWSII